MNKEFIPYEQALALKELGFDEHCFAIYGKSEGNLFKVHKDKFDTIDELHFIKAPTFSQAFRWFREKYGLQSNVSYGLIFSFVINNKSYEDFPNSEDNWFRTFEEAELACLKKLIEITKQQQ